MCLRNIELKQSCEFHEEKKKVAMSNFDNFEEGVVGGLVFVSRVRS